MQTNELYLNTKFTLFLRKNENIPPYVKKFILSLIKERIINIKITFIKDVMYNYHFIKKIEEKKNFYSSYYHNLLLYTDGKVNLHTFIKKGNIEHFRLSVNNFNCILLLSKFLDKESKKLRYLLKFISRK